MVRKRKEKKKLNNICRGIVAMLLAIVCFHLASCIKEIPIQADYEPVVEVRDGELRVKESPEFPSCSVELDELIESPSLGTIRSRANCTWDRELYLLERLYILEQYIRSKQ